MRSKREGEEEGKARGHTSDEKKRNGTKDGGRSGSKNRNDILSLSLLPSSPPFFKLSRDLRVERAGGEELRKSLALFISSLALNHR